MPGPIPKRSEERTRKNKTGEDGIAVKKGLALDFEWTEADEDWPEPVIRFYNSFQQSGMQAYYQQTDVETLWLACAMIARQYESGKPSAMMWGEATKMMDGLGATEGERRRMKIELENAQDTEGEQDAKVTRIEHARSRLGVS